MTDTREIGVGWETLAAAGAGAAAGAAAVLLRRAEFDAEAAGGAEAGVPTACAFLLPASCKTVLDVEGVGLICCPFELTELGTGAALGEADAFGTTLLGNLLD